MADLFLQVEGILIWLGDELQDKAIAFALIQEFEECSASVASASDNTSADVETFRSRVQTDNTLRHAVGRLLTAGMVPSHLGDTGGCQGIKGTKSFVVLKRSGRPCFS